MKDGTVFIPKKGRAFWTLDQYKVKNKDKDKNLHQHCGLLNCIHSAQHLGEGKAKSNELY